MWLFLLRHCCLQVRSAQMCVCMCWVCVHLCIFIKPNMSLCWLLESFTTWLNPCSSLCSNPSFEETSSTLLPHIYLIRVDNLSTPDYTQGYFCELCEGKEQRLYETCRSRQRLQEENQKNHSGNTASTCSRSAGKWAQGLLFLLNQITGVSHQPKFGQNLREGSVNGMLCLTIWEE